MIAAPNTATVTVFPDAPQASDDRGAPQLTIVATETT
jgi:hypothetical protein